MCCQDIHDKESDETGQKKKYQAKRELGDIHQEILYVLSPKCGRYRKSPSGRQQYGRDAARSVGKVLDFFE